MEKMLKNIVGKIVKDIWKKLCKNLWNPSVPNIGTPTHPEYCMFPNICFIPCKLTLVVIVPSWFLSKTVKASWNVASSSAVKDSNIFLRSCSLYVFMDIGAAFFLLEALMLLMMMAGASGID